MLLGWRPAEFWAATPAELACVLDALTGRAPGGFGAPGAGGRDLARLQEMFPDG